MTPIRLEQVRVGDNISALPYGISLPAITNLTVVGIVSGYNVRNANQAATDHAGIYPAIPIEAEVEDDFREYNYLQLIDPLDETPTVIEYGMPWLVPSSVTINSEYVCTVILENFDPTQRALLRSILVQYGYQPLEISVVQTERGVIDTGDDDNGSDP